MSQSISQRRPDANTNTGAGDSRGQPADVLQTFQPANGLRRHQPLNKLGLARTMWTVDTPGRYNADNNPCPVQCPVHHRHNVVISHTNDGGAENGGALANHYHCHYILLSTPRVTLLIIS